jgi:hypothetical protein
MLKRYLFLFTLSAFFVTPSINAKDFDYLWPIEKSHKLSSLFADYRSFHFHSGIDICTGGETGYKVFACEDGYVYRLFTSYWGYGKALYLKLDDGRYVVYGHLSDFAKNISDLVMKEQLKKKRYFTDLFLEKDKLRVRKGELIGYSGQSGLGGPHLHFEIRDEDNNPINPLSLGFFIQDKFSPVIEYLAIRPLEVGSKASDQTAARLDGSHSPLIFPCRYDPGRKLYTLSEIPVIEGRVGLELSVFDKMDNSGFKFGVCQIQLFLDGKSIFASHYDTIRYDNTQKIELDRDFELRRKKRGEFYKLYADEGNDLPLYNPNDGIIDTKGSTPDSHQIKIMAYDANGNSSKLIFDLIFDQSPQVLSCQVEEDKNDFQIKTKFDDPDDMVEKIIFEKSSSDKIRWQKLSQVEFDKPEREYTLKYAKNLNESSLVRIKVQDTFGASSDYKYVLLNANQTKITGSSGTKVKTKLNFEYSFQDSFFLFDLNFSQILKKEPEIELRCGDFNIHPFLLEQIDEKSYEVVFPFHLKEPKQMTLLVNGEDIYRGSVKSEYVIPISIVTKSSGGEAKSEDGKAQVKVDPKTVYEDMNLSIERVKTGKRSNHKVVGQVYSFEPSTIPLNGFAKISLKYTAEDGNPKKLGLYELTEGKWWRFIGQELDTTNKTVSGKVRYFSRYALLADITLPWIKNVYPYDGEKFQTRHPQIQALVGDDLSGIGSDEDILVTIDGEWMIAEYDPETNVLSARPTSPLSYGKHEFRISVKDRAGNESKVKRYFFVVG